MQGVVAADWGASRLADHIGMWCFLISENKRPKMSVRSNSMLTMHKDRVHAGVNLGSCRLRMGQTSGGKRPDG